MIGSYPCNISFHNDQLFHCTINGLLSSSENELPVIVSKRACRTPNTVKYKMHNLVLKILVDRPLII